MVRKFFLMSVMMCMAFCMHAQLRDIPVEVTKAFQKQYPGAEQVSYKDNLKDFQVNFSVNDEKMVAKYTAKGEWKETERETTLAKLPASIQDGFEKSKYADWKLVGVTIISLPSGAENYRVKVEKNELQRKFLFFNKNGRLIRDAITI